MKPRRLPEWQDRAKDAIAAMEKGEWWDGERWRAHADLPRTDDEAEACRTAHEVLTEALNAIGAGGRGRRSARKFKQREKADRDYHASTLPEVEADAIFKAAQPHLRATRTPWKSLAARLSRDLKKDIDENRLRMICRKRGTQ